MHDEGGIFVGLLTKGVKLSDSIIESLLSEVASLVRRVEDLVIEDRKVQGKTKANGVCGSEIGLGDFGGILVGLKRFVGGALSLLRNGKLSEVTVVVALPVRLSDHAM